MQIANPDYSSRKKMVTISLGTNNGNSSKISPVHGSQESRMPDYSKRAYWLRGVARHLDDQALAAVLDHCADRMIMRVAAQRQRISAYTKMETIPAGLAESV